MIMEKYQIITHKKQSRIIDFTGQQIGDLKILYRDNQWYRDGLAHWICQCSCGNICSIPSSVLRSKKRITYSCGCKNQCALDDLTGQQFGEWTVLRRDNSKKDSHTYWICKCSCGNIRSIAKTQLTKNRSTSCGCIKQSLGERKIKKILIDNSINFKEQKTFNDCKNIHLLFFDFYLPEYNTLIEYDGIQHFQSVEAWGGDLSFQQRQHNDKIKNNYCKDKGINLIRIPYTHYIDLNLDDLLPYTSKFLV